MALEEINEVGVNSWVELPRNGFRSLRTTLPHKWRAKLRVAKISCGTYFCIPYTSYTFNFIQAMSFHINYIDTKKIIIINTFWNTYNANFTRILIAQWAKKFGKNLEKWKDGWFDDYCFFYRVWKTFMAEVSHVDAFLLYINYCVGFYI